MLDDIKRKNQIKRRDATAGKRFLAPIFPFEVKTQKARAGVHVARVYSQSGVVTAIARSGKGLERTAMRQGSRVEVSVSRTIGGQ